MRAVGFIERESSWRRGNVAATRPACALATLALLVAAVGCNDSQGGDDSRAQGLMRMVGIEYGRYQIAHNGAPPADEAAFREFLDMQIRQTPDYGVGSAEELLKSPRDGQPLSVFYGKKVASPEQPDVLWAACEQTGVGGQRLVVNTRGSVMVLPTEEIDRVTSN